MFFNGSVAAVAGNSHFANYRRTISIDSKLNRKHAAGVAKEAFRRNRPGEIRQAILLESRRHVPLVPIRVIGSRRLKQIVADANYVGIRVFSGTDYVGNGVLGSNAPALDELRHGLFRDADGEAGRRKYVSKASGRLIEGTAERVRHAAPGVAGYFLGVARRAGLAC